MTTFSAHTLTGRVPGISYTVPAHAGPDVIVPGHYSTVVDVPEHEVVVTPAYDDPSTTVPGYYVPGPDVVVTPGRTDNHPATTIYTQGFESPANYPDSTLATDTIPGTDTNGWTLFSGPTLATATTNTRSAPRALYVAGTAAGYYGKAFSGFVVGRSYTLSGWFRPAFSTATFALGVEGVDFGTPTASAANVYTERTFTFTATTTTHTVMFSTLGQVHVDDFTITKNAWTDPLDGWTGGANTAVAQNEYGSRTGEYGFTTTRSGETYGVVQSKRTVTGLTVGRAYTFAAWVANAEATPWTALKIGVTGKGYSTPTTGEAPMDWTQLSYGFTATATSHELLLEATIGTYFIPANFINLYWDDITLTRAAYTEVIPDVYGPGPDLWVEPVTTPGAHHPAVMAIVPATYKQGPWIETYATVGATIPALTLNYIPLDILSGRLIMDEAHVPYIQADIVVWADPNALELIDPRGSQRVILTATESWGDASGDWNSFGLRTPVTRTFNLMVFSRKRDQNTGELALTLTSDEGYLLTKALVASERDESAVALQSSFRSVVRASLAKIGATLGTGEDATVYVAQAPNLIKNPSGRRGTVGYTGLNGTMGQDAGIDTYVQSNGNYGQGAVGLVLQAMTIGTDLEPNTTYTLSAWLYAAGGTTKALLYATGPGVVGTGRASDPSGTAGSFTRYSVTFTTAATGTLGLYLLNAGTITNGNLVAFRDAQLEKGKTATPYFDGSYAADANYVYTWSGAVDASTSVRTLKTRRGEDLLDWTPGMTLWDFLNPIVQALGFRLWCDEARVWHLAKTWAIDGMVTMAPETGVTSAVDTIDRNGEWYDSVVIRYAEGAVDVAGAGGGVTLTLDYTDRAYPGPFGASFVLSRAQGKGRVLDLSAISDYEATPGMGISVTLPFTPIQTGVVSSVAWAWPANTMTVTSRGLTDTPPNAWVLAPTGRTWNAASGTWTTYNNS